MRCWLIIDAPVYIPFSVGKLYDLKPIKKAVI